MQRTATTVVAVVGDGARAVVEAVGRAANVVPVVTDPDTDVLARAVAAWSAASRCHSPYCVHDADPLAAVASAWERRYDAGESGEAGELEVSVLETLTRWRAGSIELPDYYAVLDAERVDVTRRHWYLGVLHNAAPARVVPCSSDPAAFVALLPRLMPGRWWPPLDRFLDGIDRVVPDGVQPTEAAHVL